MKRLIRKAIIDTRFHYENWIEFEDDLNSGNFFEAFEEYYIAVDFKHYRVAIEGWYPDCLESIDYGETTESNVMAYYLQLMEDQFGFKAEHHNYLPNSKLSEYGVSYIAKEVDI